MTPSLKRKLAELFKAVANEAERNPTFSVALQDIFNVLPQEMPKKDSSKGANRRAAPLLDPIELAVSGELTLRNALAPLSVEQLKDIIAAYGMDQAKLAMKWKDASRIADRIVEFSLARARKGDAFLGEKN